MHEMHDIYHHSIHYSNSSKAKRFSFEWRLLSSLSIKFPMGAKLERLLFLIYSLLIKTLLLIITKVISDTDDRA